MVEKKGAPQNVRKSNNLIYLSVKFRTVKENVSYALKFHDKQISSNVNCICAQHYMKIFTKAYQLYSNASALLLFIVRAVRQKKKKRKKRNSPVG